MPNQCGRRPLIDFNDLRHSLAEDLMSSGLFPSLDRRDALRFSSLVCSPVRLFVDPAYVHAVKAWRKLLCTNCTGDSKLVSLIAPFNVLAARRDGLFTFREECGAQVQVMNRSFLLCWKSQFPSPMASWQDFVRRVSRSGNPTLDQDQVSVLRKELSFLRAPCNWSMLRGRNGPGAVSGGERGAMKWLFANRPIGVPMDFFRLNPTHVVEEPWCEPIKYGVTRALQVPKDARGPRFISCEPLAFQHAQFAVKDWLERQILSRYSRYLDPYDTGKHTAYLKDRSFCTIDLKDASDMVSRRLVWSVFPREVAEMLFRVRSTFVSVNGNIVPLRTFAPMGSSLCFDIMQCIIVAALKCLTNASLMGFHQFGDDGIVARGAYYPTLLVLASLGLKVNTTKCCGPDSRFRESCGEEWFWDMDDRTDIRPIYLRDVTENRKAATSLLLASQRLAECGFVATSEVLDSSSAALRVERPRQWRWNTQLQRMEIRTVRIAPLPPETEELDGYPGLYRWFSAKAEDHLLDCMAPRTRVIEGWFDPSDGNVVLPRPLLWPAEARKTDPCKETINGLPLKVFKARLPASEVECNPEGDIDKVTGGLSA